MTALTAHYPTSRQIIVTILITAIWPMIFTRCKSRKLRGWRKKYSGDDLFPPTLDLRDNEFAGAHFLPTRKTQPGIYRYESASDVALTVTFWAARDRWAPTCLYRAEDGAQLHLRCREACHPLCPIGCRTLFYSRTCEALRSITCLRHLSIWWVWR